MKKINEVMKKIYVVGSAIYYADWIENYIIVDDIEDADIVLFTGGEDVDPALYNKECHHTTFYNSERDHYECGMFEQVRPDQLCLGICRGSQFLCVMNGGILVQNCDNHAIGYTHGITNGKLVYDITSTHHQMQYPFVIDPKYYDLLYWSENFRSRYYEGEGVQGDVIRAKGEPEIVLYHRPNMPKCLAIQGHPEMMFGQSPVIGMLNNLLNSLLNTNNN